jgi:hypothetical protein
MHTSSRVFKVNLIPTAQAFLNPHISSTADPVGARDPLQSPATNRGFNLSENILLEDQQGETFARAVLRYENTAQHVFSRTPS